MANTGLSVPVVLGDGCNAWLVESGCIEKAAGVHAHHRLPVGQRVEGGLVGLLRIRPCPSSRPDRDTFRGITFPRGGVQRMRANEDMNVRATWIFAQISSKLPHM